MPPSQRSEYEIPRVVHCPGIMARHMHQINHWFSGGGTSSVLHKDANDNLNCLLDGSKDLVFINKSYTEHDLHWDHSQNHHHSRADCDAVDLLRYPRIAKVGWWSAHMEKGDCLFIPVGWFHHVKSHGSRNYAINLWFDVPSRKLVEDCEDSGQPAGPTTADRVRFVREELPEPPEYEEEEDL